MGYISGLGLGLYIRAVTTFKLEGEVIFLSESSQGEVEDKRVVGGLLEEVDGD